MKAPKSELDQAESFARFYYDHRDALLAKLQKEWLTKGQEEGANRALRDAVQSVLEKRFGSQGKKVWLKLKNKHKFDWKDFYNQALISKYLQSLVTRYLK